MRVRRKGSYNAIMKFETKEKTIEINRFFQKIFFVILLFIFVFMSVGLHTEDNFNPTTIFFVLAFIILLLIHIFILSLWSWYSLVFNWLVLNIIMYRSMWVDKIHYGHEGGMRLGDTVLALSIVSIPIIINTFFIFYFKPNNKRYNKHPNPK